MMEPGHLRRKGSDPNGNIAGLNELTSGFDSNHSPVRTNDRVCRFLLLIHASFLKLLILGSFVRVGSL